MKVQKQEEGQRLKRVKQEVTGERGPRGGKAVWTNRKVRFFRDSRTG